ncbi:MAG: ATP-dependent helicase [Treponema sp.]|nr:ATP-dependent helicase [Treponema sp.]
MTKKIEILETLFEIKKFTPNESQRKAILHTSGPLFLTAGPGSGKTRVLLWRTLNLIVFEEVKPEEIFLATFTEKAAHQLKEGLQGLLSLATKYTHKPYDISQMYVGTLHSLCQKILVDGRFAAESGKGKRPAIMDDLDQYLFISNNKNWNEIIAASGLEIDLEDDEKKMAFYKSINEWFGDHSSSKMNAVKNCISFFNRMSEEDFSDTFLEESKNETAGETETVLINMTLAYRKLLRQGNSEKVDFASLQQSALNFITVAPDFGNIFKHVIVDEYQDTNTIQQSIYMALSSGHHNICVVGDDDQALYRFRGATVENLIDFENICEFYLQHRPTRIDLNINYRSRKQIVNTYVQFIEDCNWANPDNANEFYRIMDKNIKAFSKDERSSVLHSWGKKEEVVTEIVDFVIKLKQEGKIADYNQCAFLFPSLRGNQDGMSAPVKAFADAFREKEIPFHAPRAKNFLFTDECLVTFGLLAIILRIQPDIDNTAGGMKVFHEWIQEAITVSFDILTTDKELQIFINNKRAEIAAAKEDYELLKACCENQKLDLEQNADETIISLLRKCENLHPHTKEILYGAKLFNYIQKRNAEKRPLTVSYVLARATALRWTLLDLFYQLQGFTWFCEDFQMAEAGYDGGLYNFGLISQYLSKYMETHSSILTGRSFEEDMLSKSLFFSYLYTLFRRGEGEYEDDENPFPKGAVPFLTIHQSKGLEFPVVVLGSVAHRKKSARPLDVFVRNFLSSAGNSDGLEEPLEMMDEYDTMRMFYVALSRAKDLLVISQFKGAGQTTYRPFDNLFINNQFEHPCEYDLNNLPASEAKDEGLAKVYSYTEDYLSYIRCPRNYMAFKKYGFVPSRSQTIFFSSLVHRTIEDLQNYVAEQQQNGGEQ